LTIHLTINSAICLTIISSINLTINVQAVPEQYAMVPLAMEAALVENFGQDSCQVCESRP